MSKKTTIILSSLLLTCSLFTFVGCSKKNQTSQEVSLGMSQNKVSNILGKASKVNDNTWYYYDSKIQKKEEKYYQLVLDSKTDEANELLDELTSSTYNFTLVRFNLENNVNEVFVDKKHHFSLDNDYSTTAKELKDVKLSTEKISYFINGSNQEKLIINDSLSSASYYATFKDGSYIRKYVENASVTFNEKALVTWSDSLSSYQKELQADSVGRVDENSRLVEWTQKGRVYIPTNATEIVSNLFLNRNDVTSIVIPTSVKKINEDAFKNCSNLHAVYFEGTLNDWLSIQFANPNANPLNSKASLYFNNHLVEEVTIPSTVTELKYSFNGCTSLTKVNLNSTIAKIYADTFLNCSKLTQVNYVKENATASDWNAIVFENSYANPLNQGADLYFNDTLVTELSFNATVTSINAYAFSGCKSITKVSFASTSTLNVIKAGAFENCPNLEEIKVPNSITKIESYAFLNCNKLVLNEYDNALYLGNDTNQYLALLKAKNNNISEVTINANTIMILDNAFKNCNQLTSIQIPEKIKSIGSFAFSNCLKLSEVTIASNTTLTELEDGTFYNCSALKNITLPNQIVALGDSVFAYCSQLETIQVSNQLVSIGNNCFTWCSSLQSITIPATTTIIKSYAFYKCSSLTINCETTSALSTWDNDWNVSDCPVNYKTA